MTVEITVMMSLPNLIGQSSFSRSSDQVVGWQPVVLGDV